MDSFIEALLSEKTDKIPDEYDFSDITADSFHWENVRLYSNGERKLVCEIFGRRVK